MIDKLLNLTAVLQVAPGSGLGAGRSFWGSKAHHKGRFTIYVVSGSIRLLRTRSFHDDQEREINEKKLHRNGNSRAVLFFVLRVFVWMQDLTY